MRVRADYQIIHNGHGHRVLWEKFMHKARKEKPILHLNHTVSVPLEQHIHTVFAEHCLQNI
jgi:hypothetical protein